MFPAPRVSVVLPVYNAEHTIHASIRSVLNQTLRDFELIVVDDGSTDDTRTILEGLDDPRLRVVHQENGGIAAALNGGVVLARGEFIARQDADDISLSDRLRIQVDFLDRHPDYAVVGTWGEIWRDEAPTGRYQKPASSNGELQYALLFDACFVHPSVMMRRSAFDEAGAYSTDPAVNPPEDYDLWIRMARRFKLANVPKILLQYRDSASGISRTRAALMQRNGVALAVANIHAITGDRYDDRDVTDLVCVLRKAHDLGAAVPRWPTLERIMDDLRGILTARWPDDAADVDKAHGAFLARMTRNRRMWLANWLLRRLRPSRRGEANEPRRPKHQHVAGRRPEP